MRKPITLRGKINNGILHLDFVPDELKGLLKNTYQNENLIDLPDCRIECVVMYTPSPRGDALQFVPGSVVILEDEPETLMGWTKIAGTWFDSYEEVPLFNAHYEISRHDGLHGNVLIVGESGLGKTARARSIAQHYGLKFVRVNVALVKDELAIYGTPGIKGEETVFTLSEFAEVMTDGNAVLLLDEANRTKAKNLNAVFSILDDDRKISITPPGSTERLELPVGPGVMIMATANIGYKFAGTDEMDFALVRRFADMIEVQHPPIDIEVEAVIEQAEVSRDMAESIMLLLREIREEPTIKATNVTTGISKGLQIATKVKHGLSMRVAFKTGILNWLGQDHPKYKDINDKISKTFGV